MASVCGKWKWEPVTYKHTYTENTDPHYRDQWLGSGRGVDGYVISKCHHARIPGNPGDKNFRSVLILLPPSLQLSTELTSKNSTQQARRVQAQMLEKAGYDGPVAGGEVIALRNLLAKLGKSDHMVHGWRLVTKVDPYYSWRNQTRLIGPNYLFKSPIKGLNFKDFIMLARMYKDGKGLKDAVKALLARVPEELKGEAETFRTVDVLAGLGEQK